MIFRRKKPLSLGAKIRGSIWPASGFRRAGRYLLMRIKRMPGTPHSIAAGIASGAAVSCTPLVGFHFLLGFGIAYLLRGNLLAAAIGTAFGNPWTFPFLWAVSFEVGIHLLPADGPHIAPPHDADWTNILADFGDFFWPTLVGAFPLGLFTFVSVYFVTRKMVAMAQAKRMERRERALARRRIGRDVSVENP